MAIMCRLRFHRWGLIQSYCLPFSRDVVYRPACERCGKLEARA